MENNGKVSIIVAAYNAERFLDECIKSVLNQTYKNWELIIVNDGSTDSTKEIAESYLSEKVKVINQSNQGAITARNVGFYHAEGEFLVILDADDIIYNTKLEKQVDYIRSFESFENVSLVFGRSHICDENLQITREAAVHMPDENYSYRDKIFETNLFPIHAAMFRKDNLKKLHSLDDITIPDWELWLEVIEYGNFKFHNDFVCAYRHHESMSAKKDMSEFQIKQREGIFKKIVVSPRFLIADDRVKFNVYYSTARSIHKFSGFNRAVFYYKSALKYNIFSIKCIVGLIFAWFKFNV